MKNFIKLTLLFSFLSGLLFHSFFSFSVKAQNTDFIHDINATYEITPERNAKVDYVFTTTNKIDNNYLQSFSFRLPFEPKNITVNDSPTEIKVSELKKLAVKNLYQLTVDILSPHYGIDKNFVWKIKFDLPNFVFDYGKQSAAIIPSFQDETNISSFNINVIFPDSLGKLRTRYGNAETISENGRTHLSYSSKNNKVSNFLFLLGEDQEYAIETADVNRDITFNLPEPNPYQQIYYAEFPKRSITLNSKDEHSGFLLQKGEKIRGSVKLGEAYDKKYDKQFSSIVNNEVVDEVLNTVKVDAVNKYQTAKDLFYYLSDHYIMSDFLTTVDTTLDLKMDKKNLNPAELNRLYRDVLTKVNIENRAVFGYVYPAQSDVKADATAKAHIWTEFWDGEKWIVTDPAWYISSKGTDYFDKNQFHHIKFGTYQELTDLKNFFINADLITIVPHSKDISVKKEGEIILSAYNDTYLTKEFRMVLTNTSNQPLLFESLSSNVALKDVQFKSDTIELDRVIYPNSQIDIALPLEYGFLLTTKKSNVKSVVRYSTFDGTKEERDFQHDINVKSNISSFLVFLILIGMLFLVPGTAGALYFYRRKLFFFQKRLSVEG
jgi:uncharacterized protein YneR